MIHLIPVIDTFLVNVFWMMVLKQELWISWQYKFTEKVPDAEPSKCRFVDCASIRFSTILITVQLVHHLSPLSLWATKWHTRLIYYYVFSQFGLGMMFLPQLVESLFLRCYLIWLDSYYTRSMSRNGKRNREYVFYLI